MSIQVGMYLVTLLVAAKKENKRISIYNLVSQGLLTQEVLNLMEDEGLINVSYGGVRTVILTLKGYKLFSAKVSA